MTVDDVIAMAESLSAPPIPEPRYLERAAAELHACAEVWREAVLHDRALDVHAYADGLDLVADWLAAEARRTHVP